MALPLFLDGHSFASPPLDGLSADPIAAGDALAERVGLAVGTPEAVRALRIGLAETEGYAALHRMSDHDVVARVGALARMGRARVRPAPLRTTGRAVPALPAVEPLPPAPPPPPPKPQPRREPEPIAVPNPALQALVLRNAAADGSAFCEQCQAAAPAPPSPAPPTPVPYPNAAQQALTLKRAAEAGAALCEKCEAQ